MSRITLKVEAFLVENHVDCTRKIWLLVYYADCTVTFIDIPVLGWLSECDLDRTVQLRSDYTVVAASAMTEKTQSGFLCGRPFGGLAVMVKNSVSSKVRTVGIHGKCSCPAVMITLHGGFNFTLINVLSLHLRFLCYF